MNETQPLPTDATLHRRCAEIVEWQRTGILSGTALREYASAHWAGRHDALQMAERDTSLQAMEAVAKWGTPALVGVEPVAHIQRDTLAAMLSTPSASKTPWPVHRLSEWEDKVEYAPLYTAEVLAMGRVPLPSIASVEMIDAAMVEMQTIYPPLRRSECRQLIDAALGAAHKFKQGGKP